MSDNEEQLKAEEARLKAEEVAAEKRLKAETARLKAKEKTRPEGIEKPKEKKRLPNELYLILTSGTSAYSSGRSGHARKYGGFQFNQGNMYLINHPTDIIYFIDKILDEVKAFEKIPKEYAHRHLIDRRVPEKLRIDKKGNVAKFWKDALREAEKTLARIEPTGPIKVSMVKVQ